MINFIKRLFRKKQKPPDLLLEYLNLEVVNMRLERENEMLKMEITNLKVLLKEGRDYIEFIVGDAELLDKIDKALRAGWWN